MTDLATQWIGLETAVVNYIESLTPNRVASTTFRFRSIEEQESNPDIRSAAGAESRLFELTPPLPADDETIGHTSRHKMLTCELRVIYKGGPRWYLYAHDDSTKIAHSLRAQGSAWANADFVNPTENAATIEPIVDDEGGSSGWLLTLPLMAFVEIT